MGGGFAAANVTKNKKDGVNRPFFVVARPVHFRLWDFIQSFCRLTIAYPGGYHHMHHKDTNISEIIFTHKSNVQKIFT